MNAVKYQRIPPYWRRINNLLWRRPTLMRGCHRPCWLKRHLTESKCNHSRCNVLATNVVSESGQWIPRTKRRTVADPQWLWTMQFSSLWTLCFEWFVTDSVCIIQHTQTVQHQQTKEFILINLLRCVECRRCSLYLPMFVLSVCQSVCHECTGYPRIVKPTWARAMYVGVIRCSLCPMTLASCLFIYQRRYNTVKQQQIAEPCQVDRNAKIAFITALKDR